MPYFLKAENPTGLSLSKDQSMAEPIVSKQVVALGGGKGGVGKTVMTAALGIALAQRGHRVVIVDADFGGSNLHTCMGIFAPPVTFQDFWQGREPDINRLAQETGFQNLKMICAPLGILGSANYRTWEKQKFLRHFRRIQADFVLLDLGAGTAYNEIDFFLAADTGIAIANPEPSSIQECYNFIKVCVFRKARQLCKNSPGAMAVLDEARDPSHRKDRRLMGEVIHAVSRVDQNLGEELVRMLWNFRPKLVLNMVHSEEELKDAWALQRAAVELLNVHVDFFGPVYYDENIRRAFRTMNPELLLHPPGRASQNILQIVQKKLLPLDQKSLPSDFQPMHLWDNDEEDIICSARCPIWGNCSFQKGGHPCRVKHVGFLANWRTRAA